MKKVATAIPIELTEKQQERLIEMASTLFPNRDFGFWNVGEDQYPIGMFGHPRSTVIELDRRYEKLEMHWLEFLIYKLIPTFSRRHTEVTMNFNMKNLQNDEINMIDFFYERFFTTVYK